MFYHKAMRDEQIGHFFVLELGDDVTSEEWIEHIDLLVDFWASVFLGDTLYKSDPYGPHFTIINLRKEDFTRWIELFSEAANKVYVPEIANQFREKGISYSEDFMQKLSSDSNLKALKSAINWE